VLAVQSASHRYIARNHSNDFPQHPSALSPITHPIRDASRQQQTVQVDAKAGRKLKYLPNKAPLQLT